MTGGNLPQFLTPDEVADLLRISKRAVYSMAHRGQLPGVSTFGRRLRFRRDAMLTWLKKSRAPSPEGVGDER